MTDRTKHILERELAAKEQVVRLRLSDVQKKSWEEAAEKVGMTLSRWIRRICDEAATSKGGK